MRLLMEKYDVSHHDIGQFEIDGEQLNNDHGNQELRETLMIRKTLNRYGSKPSNFSYNILNYTCEELRIVKEALISDQAI